MATDEPELTPVLDFFIKTIDPDLTSEGAAQQLLDSIHRPWALLPEGCLEGLSVQQQQSAAVALFRHLLQPHSAETLGKLALPQPDSKYNPPFLHWLMVPYRARLWDLDADITSGYPPLDPELQIRLVAAVRDHLVALLGILLGEEAFTKLLCEKDAHRANAVHRACTMSEPLFVRWLLDVLLPEDGASAEGGAANCFPPSPCLAKKAVLACSSHGWLPLHDACRHGRVENAMAYIRALEVTFGGSRWVGYWVCLGVLFILSQRCWMCAGHIKTQKKQKTNVTHRILVWLPYHGGVRRDPRYRQYMLEVQ